MEAMKPSALADAIETVLRAGRHPLIHGDPGIGKSQVTRQVADRMFAPRYGLLVEENGKLFDAQTGKHTDIRPWILEIRTAQLDACDLRGLPVVSSGKAQWAHPDMLTSLDPRGGIVFWDEINRGTELVSNSAFQLLDQGRIGDCILPATWGHAAAVNDLDVGARKMSSALQSRFIHLDAKTDLNDVCKHAILQEWEPAVIAFLRFREDLLHKYDPKARVSPNPRAWEFMSRLVGQKPSPAIEQALYAGTVGEGPAIEFMGFMSLFRNLPSIDQILLQPDSVEVPTAPSLLFAVACALSRRANVKNFGRVLKFVERMPVEYNVMCVTGAAACTEALQHTAEFTRWNVKHSDVTGV